MLPYLFKSTDNPKSLVIPQITIHILKFLDSRGVPKRI